MRIQAEIMRAPIPFISRELTSALNRRMKVRYQEIFYTDALKTTHAAEGSSAASASTSATRAPQGSETCLYCLATLSADSFISPGQGPCDCLVCKTCQTSHLKAQLERLPLKEIQCGACRCPVSSSDHLLTLARLKKLAGSASQYEVLLDLLVKKLAHEIEMHFCHSPDCPGITRVPIGSQQFSCSYCRLKQCSECGEAHDPSVPCSECHRAHHEFLKKCYRLGKLEVVPSAVPDTDLFLHGKKRCCYHCGELVEKAEIRQCNHMNCLKTGKQWDWVKGEYNPEVTHGGAQEYEPLCPPHCGVFPLSE